MKITEPHYSVLTVSTEKYIIHVRIEYSTAFSMNKPGSVEMHSKLKTFPKERVNDREEEDASVVISMLP